MSRSYVPLGRQGRQGVKVQLRPLEVVALAQIGGKHYTRLGDIIRDLLRMALAPRVAELAMRHRARADWTLAHDPGLLTETATRAARRRDPHTDADRRLVSDEPLGKMITKVPVSHRAAFGRLAMRKGMTASALLRQMVRDAVKLEVTANAPVAE